MPPEVERIDFTPIEIPRVRRGPWGFAKIAAALLAVAGLIWVWQSGYRPPLFAKESKAALEFVEIDRGDINLVVQETGTIESASNTTIRCEVEALLGTVGGTQSGASGKTGAGGLGTEFRCSGCIGIRRDQQHSGECDNGLLQEQDRQDGVVVDCKNRDGHGQQLVRFLEKQHGHIRLDVGERVQFLEQLVFEWHELQRNERLNNHDVGKAGASQLHVHGRASRSPAARHRQSR